MSTASPVCHTSVILNEVFKIRLTHPPIAVWLLKAFVILHLVYLMRMCFLQVDRSSSFLHQLIEIQKKHLAAASAFDKQLKCLRDCVSTLGKLFKFSLSADNNTIHMCSVIPNQLATYKCMWQQKVCITITVLF